MEATFRKQSSVRPEKGKQQAETQKTDKLQAFWEQLAGAVSAEKQEQNKWYKLLAHPFAVVTGLIILGYWWFNEKGNKQAEIKQENEQLKAEISRLKKKCKKIKKRIRNDAGHITKRNHVALLD